MFGFQRVGDLIWAAADQRARGFLIGATAGRTTLGGEGLQHQDGTSHLVAATVPNCRAYDPATAGELAVILDRGMREMLVERKDVFYYVTAMNENITQPSLPAEAQEGVLRGMYRFRASTSESARRVQLLAAGAMLGEAVKAAAQLEAEHGVAADLWSVTSFSELARAGIAAETAWRHGATSVLRSYVGEQLAPTRGPIVIATDYVRAVPEQIRAFLPPGRRCVTLGTDGFGRSDTRAALRAHFEVDAAAIAAAALKSLG
jgi:pyruvate dehydrogenase E1 component